MQKAIEILEDFSLYSKFGKAIMRSLKELNFKVEKQYVFNKKRTPMSHTLLEEIFGTKKTFGAIGLKCRFFLN